MLQMHHRPEELRQRQSHIDYLSCLGDYTGFSKWYVPVGFKHWEELNVGWGIGLRVSDMAVDVSMSRSQTSVSALIILFFQAWLLDNEDLTGIEMCIFTNVCDSVSFCSLFIN